MEPDFKVYNYFKDKLLKNVEQFGDIAINVRIFLIVLSGFETFVQRKLSNTVMNSLH